MSLIQHSRLWVALPRNPKPHGGQGDSFDFQVAHHAQQRAILLSNQVLAAYLSGKREKGTANQGSDTYTLVVPSTHSLAVNRVV